MAQKAAAGRAWRWTRAVDVVLAVTAALAAASLGWAFLVDGSPMAGLWLTPDQQGRRLFEKGRYALAADRFEDPSWKGTSLYQNGGFAAAADQFARVDTPGGSFNLGNAHARAGHLEQAVAAYEDTLRRKPGDTAAKENRDLVGALIPKAKNAKQDQQIQKGQPPTFDPDDVKTDDKGKLGQKGEVGNVELSADQVEQMWMRRLQTTPSDFLRLKFAAQAAAVDKERPRNERGGRQ
jgi:Ca-activated chloride channel family protein